jgi:hypothetical protein
MRSILLSVAMTSAVAFGGMAYAGTTTTATTATTAAVTAPAAHNYMGTITRINAKQDYVVLSDGWKYHLPSGFSLKGFSVGEKVNVTYEMKSRKHHVVTAMTAA